MRCIVMAVALTMAALAAAGELPPMRQPGTSDPLGVAEPTLDPRIEELHRQMAEADKAGNTGEVKRLGGQVQQILLEQQQPARPPGVLTRPVAKAPARCPTVGPDVVIHTGSVLAHATDYEMDGTMWTAVSGGNDSTVHIYKSTDHGQSWIHYWGFSTVPKTPLSKLELVVGPPDSSFIYTFYIHPNADGELAVVRMGRDTTGYLDITIHFGPDTVTDFAACRDYSGADYWLYASSHNGLRPGSSPPSRIFRSTDYAKAWAGVADLYNLDRPVLQAGARRYIYLSSVPNQGYNQGWVGCAYSTNYGEPGTWNPSSFQPDTWNVYDATIAPAFTLPDSEATVWVVYSHFVPVGTQWDALFTYRSGMADPWHTPGVMSDDTAADEAYVDVRPYTDSGGNPWINASYMHMPATTSTLYREYANAGTPGNWSDPLQINAGDAGYSLNCRPRLCYSPGAPGTGAGCVFPSAVQDQLKWNSPWYVGVAERTTPEASRPTQATVVRGVLVLPRHMTEIRSGISDRVPKPSLLDAAGRKVLDLKPGANDVRRLAPGVYFVLTEPSAVAKVVLAR